MKNHEINMTTGPLAKNILIFSIPLVFTNLLQVFFNIADIAVVGRFAGTIPLGAVGSTAQLLFMWTGLLMGIGGGVNAIVAYYIGAADKKNTHSASQTCYILCLLIGVIAMLAGIIFARPLLILIKTNEQLLDGAVSYFSIYMLGIPAVALYNYGTGVLNAAGDTKRPFLYLTFSGILNVILNLIFVITLNMSCAGVALASTISQYAACFLTLAALRTNLCGINLHLFGFKINREMALKLLKIGIPSGLQNSIFAIANTFVQVGINSFDSVMIAGVAASANLDNVVYNCMNAFYVAGAAFISQNYGAKNKVRIRRTIIISNAYSFSTGLFLGAILFFFGPLLLSIFTKDPQVITSGMERVRIMAFSYCITTFMDNTLAANRGLGKTFIPSIIIMLGSCVFRIIWVYTIFAWFKTIASLFLLYAFSWTITAIFEIIYFRIIYKKATKDF